MILSPGTWWQSLICHAFQVSVPVVVVNHDELSRDHRVAEGILSNTFTVFLKRHLNEKHAYNSLQETVPSVFLKSLSCNVKQVTLLSVVCRFLQRDQLPKHSPTGSPHNVKSSAYKL